MGVFILADKVSISPNSVVYRIRPGDPNDTDPEQDVQIPLGSDGAYLDEADITAVTGDELTGTSRHMLGKLLYDYEKKGGWPDRTGLQS